MARRRRIVRGALVAGALLIVAVALGAAAAFRWSGATLSQDGSALARLDLQPLAGSVSSLAAFGPRGARIPITDAGGRLTPIGHVPSGEEVRVDVVIRRSRWIGWFAGRTRHETLTVRTPVASVTDRWPVLTGNAALELHFTTAVDHAVVGSRTYHVGGRTLSLGRRPATGTIEVATAVRSWERPGPPTRVSWFPKTVLPAVQASPAPGSEISAATPIRLVFAQPVGTARPHFSEPQPGAWRVEDGGHTLLFEPANLGFGFGATLHLRLPRAVSLVGKNTTSTVHALAWTVAPGSLLRLHQLLAQEGYLPVVWKPAGADVRRTPAAEVRAAADPPAGSFSWRFPNTPPELASQWSPRKVTEITRGALMMFENEQGLAVDGFAGPRVWHALIADAIAGKAHRGGYSYVYVHTTLPQLLTLWHDGRTILTSPGNTGIPAAPTQPGTYPVFEHIPVGEMKGTNPDGSHYDDPGIRWISYFHGGDALHSFDRNSFGTPQSLGCVELPLAAAAKVWPYTPIGTLVTIETPAS